jgi:hypothetical protein
MSHMGQKRRADRAPVTSGLPRLADILRATWHASNVPKPEVAALPIVARHVLVGAAASYVGELASKVAPSEKQGQAILPHRPACRAALVLAGLRRAC